MPASIKILCAIRKVGNAHEKLAFAPGDTFSDKPNNVTNARKLEP
jgi:hypothetical protein